MDEGSNSQGIEDILNTRTTNVGPPEQKAQPVNVPTSFKQRAMVVDEIWHAAGDNASDIDWYAKRTVLAGIYSTTEIYMLTDTSPAPPNIAGNHSEKGICTCWAQGCKKNIKYRK
ncbi:uncharacterized protein [Arachis hypogaea]|uniref:uncharacterized protein n=1 Tax=Arachis hypogaea TaxID=3818 RepID=UPI003B2201E0